MRDYYLEVISRYRKSGILVDTNILLLYFVGYVDPKRIPLFKRTAHFAIEDYTLLNKLLGYFEKIVTTPNILSEVNSLSQQFGEPDKTKFFLNFSEQIEIIDEHYIESKAVAIHEAFVKFGLTDSVIINLSSNRFLVLTDDFRLSQYLSHQNIDVINFNHIRVAGWT